MLHTSLRTIRIYGVGCIMTLLFVLLYIYRGDIGPFIKQMANISAKITNIDSIKSAFRSKPYDVLLIGYLRGGTTFTGELLGFRNQSFYLYEPLHMLGIFTYFKQGLNCSLFDETCSKHNKTDDQILDIIRGIYTCDNKKYLPLLRPWQVAKSMEPTRMIKNCTTKNSIICLRKFVNQCSTNLSIVSKVPRISIGFVSKLLAELPHLKIVYLLRDPRAVINSRYKHSWLKTVEDGARSLCNKMRNDYQESIKTKRDYPGRLYTVFYEDLAQNPIETLKKIYNFVGYQFTAEDKFLLTKRIASSTQGDHGSTLRYNSSKTARDWRQNIHPSVFEETNKACSDVYKLLGYPELKTALDLKNENIPLKLEEHLNM